MKKPVNIAKCIHWTCEGTWTASVYKNGTPVFTRIGLTTWREAVSEIIDYCMKSSKDFINPSPAWIKYLDDCQSHIDYMIAKKHIYRSESEYQMTFSCSAPNTPDYQRANND